MRPRIMLLLAAAVSVLGCATTAKYDQMVSRWVGMSVDELRRAWGPPERSEPLADGRTMIDYVRVEEYVAGGWGPSPSSRTQTDSNGGPNHGNGGSSVNQPCRIDPVPRGGLRTGSSLGSRSRSAVIWSCLTRFVADSRGIITEYSFEGNGCRAD